ncbi:MAG: biotin--[acetyl-CoA-carboxylase] ligase [Rhodothermales bacterium]|nr:biotin--[acetyl-CoA-carboxylase] ligase [Rhodothermales bacterium]
MFSVGNFHNNLRTRVLGQSVRDFSVVSSTNDLARDWCARGAPDGALVIAEEQTAGRGRLNRKWLSEPGKNLTFSVVIRNRFPAALTNLAVVGTAVAVSAAIAEAFPVQTQIKWPNDVQIDGKKCCGILFETESSQAGVNNIIAGIGINVNQREFSGRYMTDPTSLSIELGYELSRELLLADILLQIEHELDALTESSGGVHLRYQQHLKDIGQPVSLTLHSEGEKVKGIAAGIDKTGALQIMTPDGLRRFAAGELTSQG